MRIGFDGTCLANRRGFGRFSRQVLQALAADTRGHELVVLIDEPSLASVGAAIPAPVQKVVIPMRQAPAEAASASGRRSLGALFAPGRAAARAKLDLLYFPATYSAFPVWNVGKVVVTLHDTMALTHPELFFPTRAGRFAWWLKETACVRRADAIVTGSQAARRDIERYFRLKPGQVQVLPEGPADAFGPAPAGSEADAVAALQRSGVDPARRYLLYVGGLSPHKNLLRLLEAFATLEAADVDLVLVGDFGDVFHTHVPELRAAVSRLGLGARVRFTGFVPDEALAHLYRRAYALVQPSLMEGFGLPAVEAMACGTPILCSRATSLPEVVGEAGWFFDPTSVASIADTIGVLLAEPAERDRLAARALKRSERFGWDAGARTLWNVFEAVLDPTRGPSGVGVPGPMGLRPAGRSGRVVRVDRTEAPPSA